MPVPVHHTDAAAIRQLPAMVGDAWTSEIVPRLPADVAEQAHTLQAFRRVRGIASATDLLRAVLAYVLCAPSLRRLGTWAVLIGLANLSDTAWRTRLLAASAWLLWLLGELIATPPAPQSLAQRARGRVLVLDATTLGQPGGTGDDWRVHTAYDLGAGRLSHVVVTDRATGETLTHYHLQPGDIAVADNGYGYRRSVATAAAHQAEVVLRIHPTTFPLETGAGQGIDVQTWLRQRGPTVRSRCLWCQWQQQRYPVRLIAAKLPPEATRAARQRKLRSAQKHGRQVRATTLQVAGWVLLVTTLDAAAWSDQDVLRLYRARWQVELVYKRMKQLLRLNQIRSKQAALAEATVRALLVAWALQEAEASQLRAQLPHGAEAPWIPATRPVSSWLLTAVCLDTVRQQVHGQWSAARLRACLPLLRRFLISSPRRRVHQETAVRAWLDERDTAQPTPIRAAA